MKLLLISLLKRNVTVVLVFTALLVGNRMLSFSPPAWLEMVLIIGGFFCALLWANASLIKRGHPLTYVLLSLLLVPALFPIGIISLTLARPLIDWQYQMKGFQMVDGCNGGAAHTADGQVQRLEQLVQWCAVSPEADSNLAIELRSALSIAREKARVLNDDCGRRYHCDTVPWKTEWVSIDKALKDSEVLWKQ